MLLISLGDMTINERRLAARFLRGTGIEIGASHMPIEVDARVGSVRYVDRLSTAELNKTFPEFGSDNMVPVDVICDVVAEGLRPFADSSLDFVIASHLLEHVPNPLGFLCESHRVLREGGVLYLGVPDKDYTFDRDRERTPLAHVVQDFESNESTIAEDHLVDYLIHAAKQTIPDDPTDRQKMFQHELDRSFHVHVWTWQDIVDLVKHVIQTGVTWDLQEAYLPKKVKNEVIFILEKTSMPARTALDRFDASLETLLSKEQTMEVAIQIIRSMEGGRISRLRNAWNGAALELVTSKPASG